MRHLTEQEREGAEAILRTSGWTKLGINYCAPDPLGVWFETLEQALACEAKDRVERWNDHDLQRWLDGETAEEREARIIASAKPLVNEWCDCGEDTGFRCYPEDGQCECGMHKHHVHNQCGHVVQVG